MALRLPQTVMDRSASAALACLCLSLIFLSGCGRGSATQVVTNQVPANITLSPSPNASLELGQTLAFNAIAKNSAGTVLTETFSFQSTNSAVLTVAANGVACAGSWDSLTNPLVCTAGGTGTAEVTAVSNGVSSQPVTVYVHQHITSIVISRVPNQPATLSPTCFSRGAPSGPEHILYQASAFSGATDITASVGPFSWQTVTGGNQSANSVTLAAPTAVSAPLNQQMASANIPGSSLIFSSASSVNSQPLAFTTCPVQTISVSALGNPPTPLLVTTGSSTTLNANVTDVLGMPLTGVPLTWSSTDPASVSVAAGAASTVFGSTAAVSAPSAGGGAVTASCTPPTCNGGITPSLPIYPAKAIGFIVKNPSTPANPTVYAASTACSTTTQSCTAQIVPITRSSATASFTPGTPVSLPFAPNSILFDLQGANAYFGVDSSAAGTRGLMIVNGSTVSQFTGAPGKVLAISPDGSVVITSDTADSPNLVFICQSCTSTSSRTVQTFLFSATAAAFSPDSISRGFKAYIVSGTSCPGTSSVGCLLVYSQVDAAKIVPLGATSGDVTFIGNGILGYLAGGDPLGTASLPTCDDPAAAGSLSGVSLASQFIRALPDGQSALALSPPDVQTIAATITGTPSVGVPGCPAPRGFLTIANTPGPPVNLGVGSFTPRQFLISSDGASAYILAEVVPQLRTVVTITAASASGSNTTYAYTATSGPTLVTGASIVITGMRAQADNGIFNITGVGPGTFTVVNPTGINSSGESGTGTVSPRLPFVIRFDLQTQTTSLLSLAGNAAPLSASLSPAGDLLFVGASDGAVHVVDTSSNLDTQQVTLPFPQNSLCLGQGNPATQAPVACNPDLIAAKP
jgi:trimeric autotransporter adhesin